MSASLLSKMEREILNQDICTGNVPGQVLSFPSLRGFYVIKKKRKKMGEDKAAPNRYAFNDLARLGSCLMV